MIPRCQRTTDDLNTYTTGNAERQTLHRLELIRSDSEKTSCIIMNTAGGIFIGVEGIGGQQNEGVTYEISLLLSNITLLIATHRCQQCQH
jgi:hypothetical protein